MRLMEIDKNLINENYSIFVHLIELACDCSCENTGPVVREYQVHAEVRQQPKAGK